MNLLLLLLAFTVQLAFSQNLLSVSTPNGTIQGANCPASGSKASHATQFLSIPFAEPPVGNLRFAPPVPYSGGYNGTFQATVAAPACIQFGTAFLETGAQSEDCLKLNIYVPGNTSAKSGLPVKVFIYGGAGTAGGISDALYNGCNLATDAVVVSINYRLGPLGFLALKSVGVSGNMAIQDVLLGLQWVQSNIAAFGGDPKKVLLFGQSEGAQLSFIISGLPQARLLIHSLVAESGGGRDYLPTTNSAVQNFGANWVKAIGCNVTDIACIRSKPTSIMNSSLPVYAGTTADNDAIVTSFQPSVDGSIIPVNPSKVGTQVPAIFGTTTMEGTIFIFAGYKFPPSAQNYSSYLTTNFGSYAPLINQTYSLDKFNSTPYPAFYAMVEVFTDYSFKCPTQRALLNANARGVPVWAYSWGQEPTCPWYSALGSTNAQFLALLNATHTSELPFVFAATDNLPLPNGNCTLNAFEQGLSADVIAAWTSMAANGNPNAKAFSNWPAFTSNSSMGLIVGNGSVTTGALDFTACELWDSINAGILANTTSPAPLSPAPLSPVPSPQASSSPAPHSTNSSSHSGGGLATKGSPPFGILLFWSMLSVVFASRL